MSWGLKNRLSRIIKNGKVVMLAVDHGYFQGEKLKEIKTGGNKFDYYIIFTGIEGF